ncbi:MAG: transcriptional regulator GcvA [Alphaproteobacteria bacterium]|nr:transcriptional regulator GcvA [Alphaproteobacteria bacterium]
MLELFPGLRALRSFHAAARHLSFTKAADELGVTPAAISHQIKEIEDQLGVSLFLRTSRSMALTREGEILATASAESLEMLGRAIKRIKRLEARNQLKVSASASIAAKWLVPRLDSFLEIAPGADVRVDVSTSSAALDFEREDIDIAIRFGDGKYPGLEATLLFQDTVFPVCSPSIITPETPLKQPRDLLKHKLIHLDYEAQGTPWPNWKMWMAAAGIKDFDDRSGLHFRQTSLTVQAAIDGMGVALGDSNLVADDLAAGRLVKPFALALRAPPQFAYHVVTPRLPSTNPLVALFRDWCLKQARETEAAFTQNPQ